MFGFGIGKRSVAITQLVQWKDECVLSDKGSKCYPRDALGC